MCIRDAVESRNLLLVAKVLDEIHKDVALCDVLCSNAERVNIRRWGMHAKLAGTKRQDLDGSWSFHRVTLCVCKEGGESYWFSFF